MAENTDDIGIELLTPGQDSSGAKSSKVGGERFDCLLKTPSRWHCDDCHIKQELR